MKEFKKWSKTPDGLKERGSDYAEGEAAWRAALEEVLKVCKQYEEDWDHSISDWIKKELGEEE